ncbi:MAG: hypothetical protein NVSMB19_26620 [Vulcanimicrobiaceae bacterium]
MANNRYVLYCACGSWHEIGKSVGDGIYFGVGARVGALAARTEAMHAWMWDHLIRCPHVDPDGQPSHGELASGEIFRVLSEYDPRVKARG